MQKLTCEQADWVLEQFYNTQRMKNTRNCGYLGIDNFDIIEIQKILNRCAEQPFPEFFMHDIRALGHVALKRRDNGDIALCLGNQAYGGTIVLDDMLIKQLAEGCNKIVEWLESEGGE